MSRMSHNRNALVMRRRGYTRQARQTHDAQKIRDTSDFDVSENPSDFVVDPRAMIDATYTEAQWQNQIIRAAKDAGWELIYHTWNARHSTAGFPDLILVRDGRMLAIEVKKQDPKSKVTPAQAQWIKALDEVDGVTAFVARPSDWDRVTEALE